ncbi:MAG: phytoene desaturase [Deltaproteobacteria bacterium]|nr:phytoene desaturase [Deltaproteobacteria bacterium]
MREDQVVVVGAGMGGLAAAIDLARAGCQVTVVERGEAPGGKLRQLPVGQVWIDSGPTVLTMRWVFDALFQDAGASLSERVPMRAAEILARHAWGEGGRLDLWADPDRSQEAIGDFASAHDARGFMAFRRDARAIYETLEHPFILAQRPTPMGLVARAGGLRKLWHIRPFDRLWTALGRYFRDPRLQQLFGRYATYCGSSPFLAPATLMLVAHVELAGVWLPEGGMQRLPEEMARLATQLGAKFRYGTLVEAVLEHQDRVSGVQLQGGEVLPASQVVLNVDASALARGLLGKGVAKRVPKVPVGARSLSALTYSMQVRAGGFPLVRHNVFFGKDYPSEMEDVLARRRLPQDPTVYICAADRQDDGGTPDGPERLFWIINAPPDGDRGPLSPVEIDACTQRAFQLVQRCGLRVDPSAATTMITRPTDFEGLFPGTGGALYGRATHGPFATFQRPAARTRLPGLYLAGGSVHPGPGLPMAAISGRLAAAQLLEDFPSIGPLRLTATSGGTSTRSATTAKRR